MGPMIQVHNIKTIRLARIIDFPATVDRLPFSVRHMYLTQDDGNVIDIPLFADERKSLKFTADPPDDDDEEEDDFVDLGGEWLGAHAATDPEAISFELPNIRTDATRHDVRGAMS